MVFDLVHGGLDLGVAQNVVQERGIEVGDTDGAERALGIVFGDDEGLQGLPCLLDGNRDEFANVLLGGIGPEAWRCVSLPVAVVGEPAVQVDLPGVLQLRHWDMFLGDGEVDQIL